MQSISSYLLFLLNLTEGGLLIIVAGTVAIVLYAGASSVWSPWQQRVETFASAALVRFVR